MLTENLESEKSGIETQEACAPSIGSFNDESVNSLIEPEQSSISINELSGVDLSINEASAEELLNKLSDLEDKNRALDCRNSILSQKIAYVSLANLFNCCNQTIRNRSLTSSVLAPFLRWRLFSEISKNISLSGYIEDITSQNAALEQRYKMLYLVPIY